MKLLAWNFILNFKLIWGCHWFQEEWRCHLIFECVSPLSISTICYLWFESELCCIPITLLSLFRHIQGAHLQASCALDGALFKARDSFVSRLSNCEVVSPARYLRLGQNSWLIERRSLKPALSEKTSVETAVQHPRLLCSRKKRQ